MLNPKTTDCVECIKVENVLQKTDCKISELSNTLYNNITLMLNKSFPSEEMMDLLHYKRILTYKYNNAAYATDYSLEQIFNKIAKFNCALAIKPICNTTINMTEIYSFQYKDLNEEFRDIQYNGSEGLSVYTEEEMLQGVTINYNKVGKVGFLIKNNKEEPYLIYDVFNTNITEISFDYIYEEGISYYISKEYVTHSNVYYKFVKN